MNDIFKIDDIPTDGLRVKKEEAINEIKEWFNANLNNARVDDDSWVQRGYYTEPCFLEPKDLTFALEEKKAFISWFMKTFPEFNVSYDPKKRKGGMKKFRFKNKEAKKGKYAPKYDRWWEFEVKPNLLARERDLLFGTNGTAIITDKNWRERIRDAATQEEIEDIKSLVKSRWKIDDFVHNCRGLIDITCQGMQDLKVNVGMYSNHYESAKTFVEWLFKGSLKRLEAKIQNQPGGWGSWEAKTALFREAGMKWSHYITYEALKDELEKTYDLVKEKVEAKKIGFEWDWKSYSLFSDQRNPTPTSVFSPPAPSPNSQPPQPNNNPEAPTYSDSDKEENALLSEAESNQKLEELKNLTADLAKKSPDPTKPVTKEEKEKKFAELLEKINQLEENGSSISAKVIAELRDQIGELQKQLAEIKKTLKEVLASAKDYARRLFSYFQKENIKQITFEENGTAKVEYENKQPKTFSAQEVDNHQELKELKEQVQQSEQKSLSRRELSQIIGTISSPTSTEKGHWEKYKKIYIISGGIGLLIMGGLIVYLWLKKGSKES